MIHLGFTGGREAFGFAKGWMQAEAILVTVVDQMLSATGERGRTQAVSSLWEQLTKRVSYVNNKIANSMLSAQPIFLAEMAENWSIGACQLPCHPPPFEQPWWPSQNLHLQPGPGTCPGSSLEKQWWKISWHTNSVHPSGKDGSKILLSLHVTVLKTFQLHEYSALTKCTKVERIDISRQGFFCKPVCYFPVYYKYTIQHIIKSELCGSPLKVEGMFGQTGITEIGTKAVAIADKKKEQ